ncbi:unnamed protein product [Parnassius apollo]|uniref:(apollo) hypothetical protein n=1 Tax=Parnassius apollo TaxID=110799 RepID=A0A8S3WRD0_PARAO|nr:unnamed protein product [Parnassius apollo]
MNEEDDITSVGDLDFEDSGSEYLPSPTPSSGNDDDSKEVQQCSINSATTTLPQPMPSTSTAELQLSLSEQGSAETTNETPVLKSRKRVKRPETWQRNVLKLKRAKGEQYENHKKNVIPAKTAKIGECLCPKKCHLKINEDSQLEIFRSFYALANFDIQNALLFSLVRVTNKCRSYTGREDSRRHKTHIYHLLNYDGVEVLYSNNEEALFDEVSVKKAVGGLNTTRSSTLEKPIIAEKKKKDLHELLQFVPPVHHTFYKTLKSSNSVQDEAYYNETDED